MRVRHVNRLAVCHGYLVSAGDGDVGAVETPIFAGRAGEPRFLLVRTRGPITGTFRIVPSTLVTDVDPLLRRVAIAIDREAVAALPERLPLRDGRREETEPS